MPDDFAPQDIEAEKALLGSILIDGDAVALAAAVLDSGAAFYRAKNGWVYDAMLALWKRAEPIDFVSVCSEMDRAGRLDAAYVTELIGAVPTSVHAEHYARIVERAARLRKVIDASAKIAALAYADGADADEVEAKTQAIVLELGGKGEYGKLLKNHVSDYYDRIEALANGGGEGLGLPTGFDDLDAILGGVQGYVLLAGRPSMGKSALLADIIRHLIRWKDKRVALFSLEDSVMMFTNRIIAKATGQDIQELRNGQVRDWPSLMRAMSDYGEEGAGARLWVDDSPALTVQQVSARAMRLHAEMGLDLVAVDYLQLMRSGDRYRDRTEYTRVSDVSDGLKSLARLMGIPVLAVSQLSRAVESRADKVPILSDLRESGCLSGDSLVAMANGERIPIKDIRPGQRVASISKEWKLETSVVESQWLTGTRQTFTMTIASGRELRGTDNHKFLTMDGGGTCWKPLGELNPGDFIAVPRRIPLTGEPLNSLSDAEITLLAHMIGDGCMLPRGVIHYTSPERDLGEIAGSAAVSIFKEDISVRTKKERTWYQTYFTSVKHAGRNRWNPMISWLRKFGLYGKRSHERFVPDAIFKQDSNGTRLFLAHLWATDGSVALISGLKPRPSISYSTSSKRLALGVQHLLLRHEIFSRVMLVPQGGKGRDVWYVVITGQPDVLRFLDEIGTVRHRHAMSAQMIRDWYTGRIHNTNRDVIPKSAWKAYVEPSRIHGGLTHRAMQALAGHKYCGTALYKCNLSRERAMRFARIVGSKQLEALAESDLYWDKIKSITPSVVEDVYDIQVQSNHNFLANGILAHNSLEQSADAVIFVYRDEYYNPDATDRPGLADIIVAKNKNGRTGRCSLRFEKKCARFEAVTMETVDLEEYL